MKMITNEEFTQLHRIGNTLMLVEVKGESLLNLAECIKALQAVLGSINERPEETPAEDLRGE